MASPANRQCAIFIGALSFPILLGNFFLGNRAYRRAVKSIVQWVAALVQSGDQGCTAVLGSKPSF